MDYRPLGECGLRVSPLCLGTMMFGDRTDEAEAERIVTMARDAGVNFIDTADVYSRGASENMVGRLIAQDRDSWVLASKVGNPMGSLPHQRGLSRKWILEAIDRSLSRLATDYLDIYYLHLDTADAPLEETLDTVSCLIRQGKVRYFGLSNFRGWRIAEIVMLCRSLGVPQPVVCQPYYNAMDRTPENEILPACGHLGLGVVPYSPLARGVLTGKYKPGETPAGDTRAGRDDKRIMETEFRAESLLIARKIKERAESKGMTAAHFSMQWLLNNRLVTSILAGPRTTEQWQGYLDGLSAPFDSSDEAFVDTLVPPGHPSTPGYSDPKYPPLGRITQSEALGESRENFK